MNTFLTVCACLLLLGSSATAATINAATCSNTDVQTAVDSASSGDTVVIPAGDCSWSGQVNVNGKKLTIQGGGVGTTIVRRSGGNCFVLNTNATRITAIEFQLSSSAVAVTPTGQYWRVDNCKIESSGGNTEGVEVRGTAAFGHPDGLVDNCRFINARVVVLGNTDLLDNAGWATASALGTTNAVFVEDCSFTFGSELSAIDANYGGKYVFRHNVATNSYAEAHDINGTTRACRSWEIYKNYWSGSGQFVVGNLRGGTGIFASNTIAGTYSFGMALSFARAGGAVGQGGMSDGGSFWDGNQTNGIDRASGTHTGSANAATLTDSGQSWTTDQFITPTVTSNRWIYNVTDGSKGRITANTATTITATLTGGTDNDWDNGDVYLISGGYPSRDQIGRGADSPQWSTNTTTYGQDSEIARFWENDGKTPFAHNSTDFFIVAGRDYTNSQGSWLPAPYPHPLASAASESPSSSRGPRIRGIRLGR